MAKHLSIEFDSRQFKQALLETIDDVGNAVRDGLHDVLDEWQRESVDLAPLYKRKGPKDKRPAGALRSSIHTDINGEGIDLEGEIKAAAVEIAKSGKQAGERFDYAYYLHEVYPEKHGKSFKNPSTAGTIPQFLEDPLERNKQKWVRHIEESIESELKRKGW
ncbi:HK97 gp10 family phage protein [Paenibacillus hamazuiensis]|uniref:HK97 gp10 family phage protein n=1 Tax=Paenibacillus hamazuiensis TaxID=2936508 RepID=UPI00200D97C3|nr:HK97 gp10 family phage protein [Paenibacillus hamazuiensis]